MTPTSEFHRSLKALTSYLRRKRDELDSTRQNNPLTARLSEVILRTWDLGFTAFGGPSVHFRIFYDRFVEGKGGNKWIDEQTYQELFAICQALPGPGSTKMFFCITLLHAGFIPALLVFFIWALPGALAMYGLALGVARISEELPSPVYALLSGLNASTVGIIALAAVQLAEKAIKDDISRVLVIFGACAGVCYSALWYFPVLLVIGGLATLLWDGYLKSCLVRFKARRHHRGSSNRSNEDIAEANVVPREENPSPPDLIHRRTNVASSKEPPQGPSETRADSSADARPAAATPSREEHAIPVWVGISIAIGFFASFVAVMLVRALLHSPPLGFSLFANMYLAGTIIFGGGPVVIPLLRSYVVDPGWVSSRDFLLGLAIIQAMPGPNFNFAVFLGGLTLQRTRYSTALGSFIGFVGIFFPGVVLAVAVQSFWRALRTKRWVLNTLRGVNATAVGLVFTAVYRLWEIGYLTAKVSSGQSLALNPWWVVVTALTYAESAWFKVPPALAIVIGAVLGLCWYGAVGR